MSENFESAGVPHPDEYNFGIDKGVLKEPQKLGKVKESGAGTPAFRKDTDSTMQNLKYHREESRMFPDSDIAAQIEVPNRSAQERPSQKSPDSVQPISEDLLDQLTHND